MSFIEALKAKAFLKSRSMVAFAQSLKRDGMKTTFKRYGWKVFAVLFAYYLVRDVTLYIVIPWWVARSLTP